MIGRRNMLCGMHVHVELPGPHARVGVMTRMIPFLPLFIALATASSFWRSRPTPPSTRSRGRHARAVHDEKEFDAYVGALVKAGVIKDASFIWWAMRPSLAHPTLELRASDSWQAGGRLSRYCGTVPGARATIVPGSKAQCRSRRGGPRHCGRKQVGAARSFVLVGPFRFPG